jgi:hypothetical protein
MASGGRHGGLVRSLRLPPIQDGATVTADRHPRGPEELKAAARELGCRSMTDLLALARKNDPFMFGGPADLRDAEWFADLWSEFGYTRGVHLRRVHYQVFSTRGRTATGEQYENTSKCWDDLNGAAKAARYLGLVDAEAFTDARNDPPRIYVQPRDEEPYPAVALEPGVDGEQWGGWYVPSYSAGLLHSLRMPGVEVGGYDYDPADQAALVELWIEKTTMDDVLIPVCRELNVNLLSGAGFQSITAVISLLRRAERHGKPAHVLYIADFDPAGDAMPAAVARRAQFWREVLGISAELTLDPLALTRAQVGEYALPRAPVKVDKNGVPDARGKRFEQVNGEGIVELDALEALHPGELAELVRHAVQPYRDERIRGDLSAARHQAQRLADEQWTAATEAEQAELEEISDELAGIRQRYGPVLADLNRELAERRERLADLEDRLRSVYHVTVFGLPGRPQARPPDVDTTAMLYDSRRDWRDQLTAFRAAKGADDDQAGAA